MSVFIAIVLVVAVIVIALPNGASGNGSAIKKRCPKCWEWIDLPTDGSTICCPYCKQTISLSEKPHAVEIEMENGKTAILNPSMNSASNADDGKAWLTFEGRARRREYWSKVLIPWILNVFVAMPMCVISILTFLNKPYYERVTDGEIACLIIGVLLGFVCFIAMWPVTVRRLHDKGLSGWWMLWFSLLLLIPYVGWIAGVAEFVIVGCLDGFPGPNEYGADPKGRNWMGAAVSDQSSASNKPDDVESRLKRLADLKSKGLISEDEYGKKRSTIISEL